MFTLSFRTGQLHEWAGPGLLWQIHNARHGSDAIRKYSDFTLDRHYEIFSPGRIKDNTGLISWAGWCVWPHRGKSHCSANQTFFKCESQCLWYETYQSGKGTRQPSEPSLPRFDKGRVNTQALPSEGKGLHVYSCPAVDTQMSACLIISAGEGKQGASNSYCAMC